MLALILLGIFAVTGAEAIQHYHAEKIANKQVFGKETPFFSFMLSAHPVVTIVALVLLTALVIVVPAVLTA